MSASDRQAPIAQRERLIESHLPLVRSIARRFAGRGETLDDLVQVGSIGLIRASDRFDPGRGVTFATFATPAIEGEIRRHLGDQTTSLRIPRTLQRMSGQLQRGRAQLGASLGREPTVDELATALGVERVDVERALEAERAREAPPEGAELDDIAGEYEFRASTDDRLLLALAARALNERERRIVFLRFHADMTERDIAAELGISQAQVSRSLSVALDKLREELDADDDDDSGDDEADSSAPATTDTVEAAVISPGEPSADPKMAAVGASEEKQPRSARRKTTATPSGRFLVRMPSDLHQELTVAAEREQVSLNRYVTETLASSLSEPDRPARRRGFRVLLAANVIVMIAAAAAAIALLILALERGI
jgi:RNA polymerase sigma-B factor